MRRFALIVAMGALSQAAIAQTPQCKTIANADARLACYDKATPPTASAAAEKPAAKPPTSKADTGKYVDKISAEDARMNARLKNICHGC